MKRISLFLFAALLSSSYLFGKSSIESSAFFINEERNPVEQVQELQTTLQTIQSDVDLILSKNARIQKRSSNYMARILNEQINWKYRTSMTDFEMQKKYEDFLRNGI